MTVYDIAALHINHQAAQADVWDEAIEEFEDYLSDLEEDISLGAVALRKVINGHIADFKETEEADYALAAVVSLGKSKKEKIKHIKSRLAGMKSQEAFMRKELKEMHDEGFDENAWDVKDSKESLEFAISEQARFTQELKELND